MSPRDLDLDAIHLEAGGHATRERGVCAMELVAWLADEPHSDHPQCTSAPLGAFLRAWNDAIDDEGRQNLKPYLPRVIDTAGDGHDEARGWLAADWLVRVCTPTWLELAGVTESAAALRALPELRDLDALNTARPIIEKARDESTAARAAAWAAARDAAWAAARAAARAAAWDAARAAARDAAVDPNATYETSYKAAREAADAKLEPTKVELQKSALELLERLIDPTAVVA